MLDILWEGVKRQHPVDMATWRQITGKGIGQEEICQRYWQGFEAVPAQKTATRGVKKATKTRSSRYYIREASFRSEKGGCLLLKRWTRRKIELG
jgi:hypothetical protein